MSFLVQIEFRLCLNNEQYPQNSSNTSRQQKDLRFSLRRARGLNIPDSD